MVHLHSRRVLCLLTCSRRLRISQRTPDCRLPSQAMRKSRHLQYSILRTRHLVGLPLPVVLQLLVSNRLVNLSSHLASVEGSMALLAQMLSRRRTPGVRLLYAPASRYQVRRPPSQMADIKGPRASRGREDSCGLAHKSFLRSARDARLRNQAFRLRC